MNLVFNAAANDPASALVRSILQTTPAQKPVFVLGDNPEINLYIGDGQGGYDPSSGSGSVTAWLGIGTPGGEPTGGTFTLGVSSATSGALVVGKRYLIQTFNSSDDFANVGASVNEQGVIFTATGTTPTSWTSSSVLYEITTDIPYSVTAAALKAALEATAAVVSVSVTKPTAAAVFTVEWDTTGDRDTLNGQATLLSPASAVVVSVITEGTASVKEKQLVRLSRQPAALQTTWASISNGWNARLNLNTEGILDLLGGAASASSTLELQIIDGSGNITTVGQVACLLRNEAIDEESTIPVPLPSYLTGSEVRQNFVQNRYAVSALTGGGTALDGILTGASASPTVATDVLAAIELSGTLSFYQLKTGTDAENSPDVIRPDDYDGTTNQRVWKLQSTDGGGLLAANNLSDVADATTSRNNLGLGTMATQDSFNVGIGGGSIAGITDLAVADGGTGASTASGARTNLGAAAKAGDTFTGQINFSGTTHAGIKLISLTTTQRNALTAANGMLIYNSTTATVQKYQAGAWSDVTGSGGLLAANNLSDVASAATSRTNLAAANVAGDTFTGQINFSGTNHAGIKLVSLTTTQRDALTAANGMLIYNTTNARVEQYTGGAWAAVSASESTEHTLTATTSNSVATELLIGGATQMLIPARTTWQFLIEMLARRIIVGATWTARDSTRYWSCIACSADGVNLVAGLNSGGTLYNSTDSGATWTSRATSKDWTGVASSSTGAVSYACATGDYIRKSTNYGVTWAVVNGIYNPAWSAIACSSDAVKVVAVTDGGQIYTSTDSGVTLTLRDSNRTWRGVCSSTDGVKLAACVFAGQIYTSTDSGVTWTARDSNRNWIDIKCSADGVYLVAQLDLSNNIYRSADSGVTWTLVDSGGTVGIAVSSTGKRMISGGKWSFDYGVTWVAHSGTGYTEICCDSAGVKLAACLYESTLFTSAPTSSRESVVFTGRANREETVASAAVDDMQQNDIGTPTHTFAVDTDTSTGALRVKGTGTASQEWDWKCRAKITALAST